MHFFYPLGFGPIRFKGSSSASLALGYAFFADLAANTEERVLASEASGGTGTPGDGRKRRRRNVATAEGSSGDVRQVVELDFRALDMQDSFILNSQTSSSSHVIEVSEAAPMLPIVKITLKHSCQFFK